MRKTLLATSLLLAVPVLASASDELSYTYVEGGWNRLKLDAGNAGDFTTDGGYVRGSFAVAPQFHVIAGASRVSGSHHPGDARVKTTVDVPYLGLGYHTPISENLDFTSEFAWNHRWAKSDHRVADERSRQTSRFNQVLGMVGVRGRFTDNLEGWLKGGYANGDNGQDARWYGVAGGQLNITDTWGVVLEGQFDKDTSEYRAGVRASF
ncbi:autotransporter outer membrane beta-barrel domain-containing protein [Stenotrophomonas forensis]|uniref:autotransporter outer membrane beta-barrel domain-containing protein n=1 Tax=Stenotrophomonas forensis TaxID=2871169 RepID=UPI0036D54337